MLYFFHEFVPPIIFLNIGPITIYWYGVFLFTSIVSAILLSLKIGRLIKVEKDTILDLSAYLIVGGIIGARVYDVFLELPYYLNNPLDIFKLWQGGLAIHGGIIGGFIVLYFFAKKKKQSILKLSAIITPGLALGQAIGRWGNWFNQELFGQPSNLPWSIPISLEKRPLAYAHYEFFHPTFLYESLACLLLALVLFLLFYKWKTDIKSSQLAIIIFVYLSSYAFIRFMLEFIKIDPTPLFLGLRWPQIASLAMFIVALAILIKTIKKENKS